MQGRANSTRQVGNDEVDASEPNKSEVPFDRQQLDELVTEDNDAWKHVVLELIAVVSVGVLLMAITVVWIVSR